MSFKQPFRAELQEPSTRFTTRTVSIARGYFGNRSRLFRHAVCIALSDCQKSCVQSMPSLRLKPLEPFRLRPTPLRPRLLDMQGPTS